MKGLLKNLGLILILVGVVILLACSFTGNVNNNAILGTSVVPVSYTHLTLPTILLV